MLMVKLAREDKRVVRLKSGDPMIFGRAGEEIAELKAAGIPVRVVPGITAASTMASALGISLTHREYAQSVRFIAGHGRNCGPSENIDWSSVADERITTVFYMGGRLAAEIARRLRDEGLGPDTPVVVMAAVSRECERTWHGDLSALARCGFDMSDGAPVLIAVEGALRATQQVRTAFPPASWKRAGACIAFGGLEMPACSRFVSRRFSPA